MGSNFKSSRTDEPGKRSSLVVRPLGKKGPGRGPFPFLGQVRSDVVAGEVPVARRDQAVDLLGSPGAGLVRDRLRRSLQEWLGDLPEALDRLGAAEQGPIADHDVVDQALVGVERLAGAAEGVGVAEAHMCLAELDPRPWD